MRGFNQVILIGNCGDVPDVRKMNDGTAVAKLNLATTLTYRGKDGSLQSNTDWHPIILWRGLAELADNYVTKGSLLMIKGKLKPRQYKNKEGNTVYVTEVIADEMILLDKKKTDITSEEALDEDLPF